MRGQNHSKQTQNCLVENAGTGDISLEFPSGTTTHRNELADAAGAGPTAGLPNKHVSLVRQHVLQNQQLEHRKCVCSILSVCYMPFVQHGWVSQPYTCSCMQTIPEFQLQIGFASRGTEAWPHECSKTAMLQLLYEDTCYQPALSSAT